MASLPLVGSNEVDAQNAQTAEARLGEEGVHNVLNGNTMVERAYFFARPLFSLLEFSES